MTRDLEIAIGGHIGPYQIVGELGSGGMGMVYRAVHVLLHRPAAIKVLRPELGGFAIASERFLTEARATTAIRHPGIVEIYDYGHTESGCAYIAMELLEGVSLGARLAECRTLALVDALALVRRIAAPLAVAHARGVVHRDLKPDNVFLLADHEGGSIERVKLLDFGIAKLEATKPAHRTTAGMILGTPAYMSPEQCRGISDCDHRADLYALGCILFQLLVGDPPFGSNVPTGELIAAHVAAPAPDIARFCAVPADVRRLIARLLAKAPEDRPSSTTEVVAELDRILAAREPPVAAPQLGFRFALVTAAGLAMTLAMLGAWYRWWRGPRAEAPIPDGAVRALGTKPALAPSDAMPTRDVPTLELPTIELDAATRPIAIDAATRPTQPAPRNPRDAAPAEVVPDLGSAIPADVNTVVTP
jgi:serine/threonine-protein kinase